MNIDQLRKLAARFPVIKAALYPAVVARRALLGKKYSWQEEIVTNLRQMVVGDPVLRVDEFGGVFAVDPHSDIFSRIIIHKCYEPQLVKSCARYLDGNRDVIDVGANVGFYTVMFAKHIVQKRVLAIEPTRNALRRLRRNIELNEVAARVEIFEGVASNRSGVAEIKTIKGKEEYSSLGEMEHPAIANEQWVTEKVAGATLDELVEAKSLDPGFLKVDVEGVEHLVFEGARRILSEKRPIILTELSDFLLRKNGSSAKAVIDLLKAHDYDLFDPTNPSIRPGTKDFGDILCYPKEMKAQIDEP